MSYRIPVPGFGNVRVPLVETKKTGAIEMIKPRYYTREVSCCSCCPSLEFAAVSGDAQWCAALNKIVHLDKHTIDQDCPLPTEPPQEQG